jgi:hypothetical protein
MALAEGYYGPGSAFGRDLVRDLRRLIERVRDGDNDAAVERLLARIKWNCQCNKYEIEQKVRALAREILTDWDAVIACVAEPLLSPSRVDDWRGGARAGGVAVVRRCNSGGASFPAAAPFPVAARQTGRADFPHPAFSGSVRPSLSAGRLTLAGRYRGRAVVLVWGLANPRSSSSRVAHQPAAEGTVARGYCSSISSSCGVSNRRFA